MWVDSSKIRKKAITDCKRSRTTFEKAERELLEFEEAHLPAYNQWLRTGCGPLVEEMKSIHEEIEMFRAQLVLIDEFCDLMNWSESRAGDLFARDRKEFDRLHAEALEERREAEEESRTRLQELIEEFKREFFEDLEVFLDENYERLDHMASFVGYDEMKSEVVGMLIGSSPFSEDLFLRLYHDPELDRVFAEAGFEEEDYEDDFDDEDLDLEYEKFMALMTGKPLPPDPEDSAARIKALKREMAFALHPDQAGADDPKKLALWHEVQAAADAGDLDRLEVLHAHMQVMDGELSPETPVSKLQKITQMYRESRNALRRKIRRLREEPAWDFKRKSDAEKQKILRHHQSVLRREKQEFQQELSSLRREFSRITRQPTTPKPKSPPKPKPNPEPEPLDPRQKTFDFF
ncbi:MAG: hypothetical protein JJU29_12490 [Verrucomicrobia bacterium]|nr:hypothetical protein [Verrucomicrobiota bacterium]MCH8512915.1 hypothetical protein [Kiritimatiellia bacterium]